MVLDDLWDRDFLQEMVHLCGSGVKCFVTSQSADLCRGLNFSFTAVKIQVEKEDSRKILASHVGFSDQLIPAHLDDIVDKILQIAEWHPLALAMIATAIDPGRENELRTWESALENFSRVLRESESTNHVDGDNYSKSVFSAMQLPIQRLKNDARQLLVLAHLCNGSSIPEEVLGFLYKHGILQEGHRTFGKVRRELEGLHLPTINCRTSFSSKISPEHRRWSVHSLLHLFIENEMSEEKNAMINTLSGLLDRMDSLSRGRPTSESPTHDETMVVLWALYSKPNFALKVASKMEIPIHRFDKSRKYAIEPLCRLLGQPISARWTADAESSARQVLVTYICDGELHGGAISHLLDMPISTQLPMLTALHFIARVEEKSLLNENTHGYLVHALLGLLTHRDTHCHLIYEAAKALRALSWNKTDAAFLVSSGALDEAIRLLSSDFHQGLQPAPQVQRSTNPVTVPESDLKFENFFCMPEHLLDHSSSNSPILQLIAVVLLDSLTKHQCDETKLRVVDNPRAMDQLIECLSKDSHPALQSRAAHALAHLAMSRKLTLITSSRIVNFPNALERLTLLLPNNANPVLQEAAGHAFSTFTWTEEKEVLLKIVDSSMINHFFFLMY